MTLPSTLHNWFPLSKVKSSTDNIWLSKIIMCLLESALYNMPFHPDLIKTIKPLPLPYPLLSPLPSAVPMGVPTYLPNLARSTPSRSITPLHSAAMTTPRRSNRWSTLEWDCSRDYRRTTLSSSLCSIIAKALLRNSSVATLRIWFYFRCLHRSWSTN